jgi:hypothetical protein
MPRKPYVHHGQDREHRDRGKRRPLNEEPEHHEHEPDVLGVANNRVGTGDGEYVSALSVKKRFPGYCGEEEAAEDQRIAEEVDRAQVRISLETQ